MLPNINDIIGFIQIVQGIARAFSIMVSTPAEFTFALTGIQLLWQGMATAANALMVVFLIIGATQIMISHSTGRPSAITPQALVTKFVVQVIAINTSLLLIQALINIENDLCSGLLTFTTTTIGNQLFPNGNIAPFFLNYFLNIVSIQNITKLATGGLPTSILVILALVFIFVLLLVFFQSLARLLRLNLFIILAPLAFLFLTMEQTQEYGSFILRILIITIFVQFVQVLSFCIVLFLLTSVFVGGAFDDPAIKIALAIGQLIGVFNVPNLLSHFGIESNAHKAIGTALMAARIGLKFAGVPVP